MDSTALPTYPKLVLPTIQAVADLGGSATAREVTEQVLAIVQPTEEMLAVTSPKRPDKPIFLDRVAWARSYAKLIGALESPKRAVFLVTSLGRELLEMPEEEGYARVLELDREYRRSRDVDGQTKPVSGPTVEGIDEDVEEEDETAFQAVTTGLEPERWQDVLLTRLHKLSPDAFEEFVLYLLRLYGLQLERVGGVADEGIDGIGTAPLSPVLSSRVAVQIKRYDPNGRAVGRETVALFQRDAQTKGAERAILVTLGKFSGPARSAAISTSPTVDLIDGERLADLIKEQELGVRKVTRVDPDWFNRFG